MTCTSKPFTMHLRFASSAFAALLLTFAAADAHAQWRPSGSSSLVLFVLFVVIVVIVVDLPSELLVDDVVHADHAHVAPDYAGVYEPFEQLRLVVPIAQLLLDVEQLRVDVPLALVDQLRLVVVVVFTLLSVDVHVAVAPVELSLVVVVLVVMVVEQHTALRLRLWLRIRHAERLFVRLRLLVWRNALGDLAPLHLPIQTDVRIRVVVDALAHDDEHAHVPIARDAFDIELRVDDVGLGLHDDQGLSVHRAVVGRAFARDDTLLGDAALFCDACARDHRCAWHAGVHGVPSDRAVGRRDDDDDGHDRRGDGHRQGLG